MRIARWTRWSVRTKVLVIMLTVFLISLFSLIQLTSALTQGIIRNFMFQYLSLHQEKAQKGYEFLVGEVNMLSVRLLTRSDIYSTIEDKHLDRARKDERLRQVLDGMNINANLVGFVLIVATDGTVYRYGDGNPPEPPGESFLNRVETGTGAVWSDVRRDEKGEEAYVMVGRRYQNLYTGQRLGLLVVYVKVSALYDVLKNMALSEWGDSLLLSGDRYILSAADQEKVGTTLYDTSLFRVGEEGYRVKTIDGDRTIVARFHLTGALSRNGLDWSVVSLLPQSRLFRELNAIKRYSYMLQAVFLAVLFPISWYVAKTITNPVNALARKIRRFGQGERPIRRRRPQGQDGNELALLENSFADMVVRIDDLIANINENKDRQRETELIALQAQIHPHFLYNTLDAIGWLAKLNDQEEIGKMIVELAKFYRLSLHKGDKYILVEEEFGIVESYVELEKMRFPGKFSISYEIEDEIRSDKMLKILLQPFVENAFKHGIANKRGKGTVTVKGFADGKDLVFEIVDDGPGFDVGEMKARGHQSDYRGGGYGIVNVDERIRLEYGYGCGVELRSEPGRGTIVRIRIKRLRPNCTSSFSGKGLPAGG